MKNPVLKIANSRLTAALIFSAILSQAVLFAPQANAACAGAYQRMQVGVLPDVFLNLTASRTIELSPPRTFFGRFAYPFRWTWQQFRIFFQQEVTVREKRFNHYWTGNFDLPGVGDCNVRSFVTIENVGVAHTYSPCSTNLGACNIEWFPESADVGPAIDDHTVKEWPMLVIARPELAPEVIGAIRLYGLDCQGDICQAPPCLHNLGMPDEFARYSAARCENYNAEGWNSTGPGVGDAYLLGRGNLYIGPRIQPAFEVAAESDLTRLELDHWIANDNPAAVLLVTPKGSHSGPLGFYGVKYDAMRGRWSIKAEGDDEQIHEGSRFNVYVMGHKAQGFKIRTLGGDRIWLDDPLLNGNPNALIFATHVIDERCSLIDTNGPLEGLPGFVLMPGERAPSHWECGEGYFPHPVGALYDSVREQWAVVSEDGTHFPSPTVFNIVVAGLAGKYRSNAWETDKTPTYAGRLETVHAIPVEDRMPMTQLDAARENSIVFVMHNLTPYDRPALAGRLNPSPIGVTFQDGRLLIRNLDGQDMPSTAFNAMTPLLAP